MTMPDGLDPITSCSSYDPSIIRRCGELVGASSAHGAVVQAHRFREGLVVQMAFPASLAPEFLALFLGGEAAAAAAPVAAATQARPAARRGAVQRETCPDQIVRLLGEADRPLLPSELASRSQRQPIQYAERTITRTLSKLKRAGRVEQTSAGQPYRLLN